MFFVINKDKVYAYIVSILTIVVLFFMSGVLNYDFNEVEQVSVNIEEDMDTQNDLVSNNVIDE